jgi:hypothetical protein
MSLESRRLSLNIIKNSCNFDSVNSLIIQRDLSQLDAFIKFKSAVLIYIFSSLFIKDEDNFLEEISENYYLYPNITPNGSLAPKSEFDSEYNGLVSSYIDLLRSIELDKYILKHHFPLHIRIKKYGQKTHKPTRPHATELIHSDAWAGESSNAVNFHIPLFGDVKNNHMNFFMPPPTFQTDWLRHLNDYAEGESIANLYSPVSFTYEQDTGIISDLSTLHKTFITEHSGIRISFDTTFLNLKDPSHNEIEFIHPNRLNEMLNFEFFSTLGKANLIRFSNSIYTPIQDSQSFSVGYDWVATA